MVKGVIWGRPKKTIERYAKEDLCRFGEIREELFYKAPRGRLRKAKAVRTSEKIRESGLPKKGEKMAIHTHVGRPGESLASIPSIRDLKTIIELYYWYGIKTQAISRISDEGKEIGRTIIRVKVKDREKLLWLWRELSVKEYAKELGLISGKAWPKACYEVFERWCKHGYISVKFFPSEGYYYNKKEEILCQKKALDMF